MEPDAFFEKIVADAVDGLPAWAHEAMENVAFVVEREVRRKRAGEIGIKMHEVLLGLYEGIPKTERTRGYFGVPPDKITIFQKPLEQLAGGDPAKLKRLVRDTVWHEVGHHLGLDETELRAIETRKGRRSRK